MFRDRGNWICLCNGANCPDGWIPVYMRRVHHPAGNAPRPLTPADLKIRKKDGKRKEREIEKELKMTTNTRPGGHEACPMVLMAMESLPFRSACPRILDNPLTPASSQIQKMGWKNGWKENWKKIGKGLKNKSLKNKKI